jgi:hypothetical protein
MDYDFSFYYRGGKESGKRSVGGEIRKSNRGGKYNQIHSIHV